MKIPTKLKKCTKCGKLLRHQNKSGLCSAHYHGKMTMDKYWARKEAKK